MLIPKKNLRTIVLTIDPEIVPEKSLSDLLNATVSLKGVTGVTKHIHPSEEYTIRCKYTSKTIAWLFKQQKNITWENHPSTCGLIYDIINKVANIRHKFDKNEESGLTLQLEKDLNWNRLDGLNKALKLLPGITSIKEYEYSIEEIKIKKEIIQLVIDILIDSIKLFDSKIQVEQDFRNTLTYYIEKLKYKIKD
jgi:hypothetical protein